MGYRDFLPFHGNVEMMRLSFLVELSISHVSRAAKPYVLLVIPTLWQPWGETTSIRLKYVISMEICKRD